MRFTIIIPTLNEEKYIVPCLLPLQALRSHCEIIIVDGNSSDRTRTLAAELSDHVIVSQQRRALQMNTGAQQAKGNILLFLHADTTLPDNALDLIDQSVKTASCWGRFDVALSEDSPIFKVIGLMMNWRSRLTGIATGDQAIFVKKSAFMSLGGYPDINLMEDIALSKALKKISPPVCLKAKVVTSARRWQRHGFGKTILLMWCLRLAYFFGVDPNLLAKHYERN